MTELPTTRPPRPLPDAPPVPGVIGRTLPSVPKLVHFAIQGSALGNLGQIADACEAVDEALRRKPDLSLAFLEKTMPTKQPGGLAPYLDGLRKAGLSE